jgi:HK97 family phage major capsid protein
MSKLVQTLREKQTEADSIFAAMTTGDFKEEKTQAMQAKFDELILETDELKANIEREKKLDDVKRFINEPARVEPRGGILFDNGTKSEFKSLGEVFTESASYQENSGKNVKNDGTLKVNRRHIEVSAGHTLPLNALRKMHQKATFTGSGTGLTTYDRPNFGVVELGIQPMTVADLFSQSQTDSNTVRYVKETSHTNAATTVAEGAVKPEATFNLEEADAPVRKVAVTAKVTDETFADFPQVRDYINNRLVFMVQQTEEAQLLGGSGVAPQILGLTTAGSGIQTQSLGADSLQNALYKAITKVRTVGFFEPDAIVMHPTDYQTLRLAQEGGTTGQYFGGGYMLGAFGQPYVSTPPVWGLKTVVTTAATVGNAVVGAFKLGATVFYRNGLTVDATNSNEDDFELNLITLRAEQRLALAILRPLAFVEMVA